MLKKILLPTIFIVLSYGFWVSTEFKEIAAGVSIFLFGMLFLEQGFKAFTGGMLEIVLKKTTDKVWKSVSFGFVSTTIMQSSSLVSIITISFLSAGLITLASGIGIIFGANLGTTTGAWLIAGLGLKVKISAYAMPMLVFGIILSFQKEKKLNGIGYILAGLGFLFLGIHHMKEGFETFGSSINLTDYSVGGFKGLLLFTLIGLLATVVMQSSHATLVLIITALAANQITYENGLALAIGSNVGTTITAILGSISANINGKRLAGAHLIFNAVTGVIAIALLPQLIVVVDILAVNLGIGVENYTLKLALFHTLFNIIGIVVMLPFLQKLASWLLDSFPDKEMQISKPKYINEAVLSLPDTALEAVEKETFNLFEHVVNILCDSLNVSLDDIKSKKPIKDIVSKTEAVTSVDIEKKYLADVKGLYGEIVEFISHARQDLTKDQNERFFQYRTAGQDMVESIKEAKHLYKNLSLRMNDENPHIKDEYNTIRQHLLYIIRYMIELHELNENQSITLLSLDIIKHQIDENNTIFFDELDEHLKQGHITGIEASSIMKDKGYANHIAFKLLDITTALFAPTDQSMIDANESMQLTHEEIAEALKTT